ncbi:kinesin family member 18/19 [Xylona heveae TC161]|uniref:Kinesin family member 18/19 n=1 Tax=Xylona heveae (strain CBS 132557 / TC161) TaxID=1328760 RepID=A0A161TQ64_XYLHT|nr:kinesin family member 18/19 [Xylona heveae TC161]KZF24446.1 kinesin family member 18/19 [Xylona heveae TC161]
MAAPGGASSISVTVRVRPFTIREAAQLTKCDDTPFFLGDGSLAAVPTPKLVQKGIRPVIKVVDNRCLVFDPPEDNPIQRFSRSVVPTTGKRVKDQTFAFDRVFEENASQQEVYESTTKGLLDSVMDGYNATVFAYGATGCGKTHTITGTSQQPGIIFMTMQELFERIAETRDEKETEVSLSYLEIYNETIRDLLVPGGSNGGSRSGLMLREDANQAVSVAGLSSHRPQNVQEVMDMIVKGNEYRTMSPTEANATSSRSHAVLQINVSQRDRTADVNEPHTMATLSIIDLAGSERASATKNRGERLIEGANINKSLLALGSCINALCDPRKKNHVPYRNSKLTRLLKFSLGGNCKTVMIVCVSPSSQHFDETQNTLRYANRAKNIQTKVTRNVFNVNRHVKDFLKKIDEQMNLINELKQQQKDYETNAFAKFRKQLEKRDHVAKEGITRIRSAFDHTASERQEKMLNMRRLRQIERRISMLSAWIAAFDYVCEARGEENPPDQLAAVRKSAQGILVELESSRHHYHQRLSKCDWERSMDSALQNALKQLKESEGPTGSDPSDAARLIREVELLKANAEREGLSGVLEQEKGGDAGMVQMLLQAHFDTISSLHKILQMDEQAAVEAAKSSLGNIITECSDVTSQVVKPDGSLPLPEPTVPSWTGSPKRGTPKRPKQVSLVVSPMKPLAPALASAAHLAASPVKGSPKRRKAAVVRKAVSFTPKKKAPMKTAKRGVRWKDDSDEGGMLAEFEKTPQRYDSTPEEVHVEEIAEPTVESSVESPIPSVGPMPDVEALLDSSPIPTPPKASIDIKPKSNRFQTGFLSKKHDGSPGPVMHPRRTVSAGHSSPLRELEPGRTSNRASPTVASAALLNDSTLESGSNSGSDEESRRVRLDKLDDIRKRAVTKRASSTALTGAPAGRTGRQRSPTASSLSSPPGEKSMFTAGQARRMVRSDKENDSKGSVLSPRTAPVIKGGAQRRTTIGEERTRPSAGLRGDAVRLVTAGAGAARGSLTSTGKSAWR